MKSSSSFFLLLTALAIVLSTSITNGFSLGRDSRQSFLLGTLQRQRAQHHSIAEITEDPASSTASNNDDDTAERPPRIQQAQDLLQHYRTIGSAVLSVVAVVVLLSGRQEPTLQRNILSGTLIFSLGDWGAQLLEQQQQQRSLHNANNTLRLDRDRLAIAIVLGAVWAGVGNPSVYAGVERLLPGSGGGNVKRVLLKMVVSCSILSTAGNYFTMMFRRLGKQLLLLATGRTGIRQQFSATWSECISCCNHDFVHVLGDDLKVWPLYDIVCYSVIPPSIRPITNAIMASLWSMYMSIASAKTSTRPDAE